jgi:hypothetical protein
MVLNIKKQLSIYQSWIDLAYELDISEMKALNRYNFITFTFVFVSTLLTYIMVSGYNPSLAFFTLIMHLFLGVNILKARSIVVDALEHIKEHKNVSPKIAKFLNGEYSLFLVSQGKNPLSEEAMDNLEVHRAVIVKNQISRGGRSDAIKRFRVGFLEKEKVFFNSLYGLLLLIEFFLII